MNLTRREFLDRSVWAAAGLLASSRLSWAHATEPENKASAKVGANDKIHVAVIGVNGRGKNHIAEWLRIPEVELVAICDCDPAAYESCVPRFKTLKQPPRYVKDVRKLLEDQSIDAVSIATPNHWHALMAVWAMQAGKDVYVEKPCSHNVREGRVITDWARKLGRMCQMGVQSRSMNGMRQALDFIHSGKIGKVSVARAICWKTRNSIGVADGPAPIPPGLDFDLWCGPAPLVVPHRKRLHYDWHWFWETGNGDLGNQNPHELDKARWGLDKHELPKRVVSLGGRLGYIDDGQTANSQITICEWDDAMLISDVRGLKIKTDTVYGQKRMRPGDQAANIWYGTDGLVFASWYQDAIALSYKGEKLAEFHGGDEKAHYENFLKAVRSRNHKDLHLDIEEGHLSAAMAHLGNASLRTGKAVPEGTLPSRLAENKYAAETLASFEEHLKANNVDFNTTKLALGAELTIDPKAETSDNKEANKLFTREYRKGYELPEVSKS